VKNKKIHSILYTLVVLTALLLSGCYDDFGNDVYKSIDEVKISFTVLTSDSLVVSTGDSLNLRPTIKYTGDTTNLSYEWKIFSTSLVKDPITGEYPSASVISRNKKLSYQIIQGPGQYMLVYTITDKNTGVKTYYKIYITVETIKGLIVLDRKSDLSNEIHVIRDNRILLNIIANDREGVVHNLFSGSNGGQKLSGATAVYRGVYRVSSSFVFSDDLYIFGDSLALKVDPSNYKITSNSIYDFFVISPPSFNVQAQVMPKSYCELVTINGRIYCYSRIMIGNKRFGIDIAPSDNYSAAPFLPYIPVSGIQYGSVIFDKTNHCFRPINQFGSSLLNLSDTITKPFDLKKINMDLKYIENGNLNYTYSIFQDPNDYKPYLLAANFAVVSGVNPKPIYKIDLSALPDINNAVDYTFSTKGHVLFYATPSAVYSATYKDGKSIKEFTPYAGEVVTKIKIFKDEYNTTYDGKLLFITTQNTATGEGKIYIVQFNGANGVLDLSTIKSYGGFAKILQTTLNN